MLHTQVSNLFLSTVYFNLTGFRTPCVCNLVLIIHQQNTLTG